MITLLGVIFMPSKCLAENHIWSFREQTRNYYCPKCNKTFPMGLFADNGIYTEPSIADITATLTCKNGACQI